MMCGICGEKTSILSLLGRRGRCNICERVNEEMKSDRECEEINRRIELSEKKLGYKSLLERKLEKDKGVPNDKNN